MFSPSYLAFVVSGMQRYFLVRQRIPWKKLLFCLNFAVFVCTVGVTQSEAGSYSAVLRCRNGSGFSTFFLGGRGEGEAMLLIRKERERERELRRLLTIMLLSVRLGLLVYHLRGMVMKQ